MVQRVQRGDPGEAGIAAAAAAIAAHLDPQDDAARVWRDRIEQERARLAQSDAPLVDGRFGAPGPFDEGRTVADIRGQGLGRDGCVLLMLMARMSAAARVLELGANTGVSSAYLAAGQRQVGSETLCVTIEASPYRRDVALAVHEALGLTDIDCRLGFFAETLPAVLAEHPPFDLVFVDGDHQLEATLRYTEMIMAQTRPGAIIAYDDIRWSEGMAAAWRQIRDDDRLVAAIDLGNLGVVVKG